MHSHWTLKLMRRREFAYAEVYCHPPMEGPAFDRHGRIKPGIAPAVASVCKNESNCTLFLADGTCFTTWSQGSFEHALDERLVFATSTEMGRTWSEPRTILQSTAEQRRAYAVPFLVPPTGRLYVFYQAGNQAVPWHDPAYDSGCLCFVFSDDRGQTWAGPHRIDLPDRDINVFPGLFHGWLNHPPQIMPHGDVILPITYFQRTGLLRRAWMLNPAEVSVIRCDNILTETDPDALRFTLLPQGTRGIRADAVQQIDNPAVHRLTEAFNGLPEQTAFNFQEMTVVPMSGGRWLGVGRTFLGSPGYTVSKDRGLTWPPVEPLRYAPDGEPIRHPMTMCPIARLTDGRFVLLFTNNDGSQRGSRHVWDGDGRTRNPQWIAVGRELPGETRNGGLVFGRPMILSDVDDTGEVNLKTGVSMPQFLERDGRYFVMYNINKEHILLDEIPAATLAALTPA
jgi:hypothetical protein